MKRCSTVLPMSRGWQAKRWTSYDKSTLTDEALLERVEAGLGTDQHGKPLRVNPQAKTVSTAFGPLPISPIFDPAWIKTKRRPTKPAAEAPCGRFRKKLTLNPYARALSSPLRKCGLTQVTLPRYFLQDFEVINHPETGDLWFAPGPLSFERVLPKFWDNEPAIAEDWAQADAAKGGVEAMSKDKSTSESPDTKETKYLDAKYTAPFTTEERRDKAPLTSYTISKNGLFDPMAGKPSLIPKILGPREGTAMRNSARKAVFRTDMSDLLLKMLRKTAVDALIIRTDRTAPPMEKFVQPVSSWEEAGKVKRRGCVLWLRKQSETKTGPAEYATIDVPGVSYGGKMAVHNLNWLLGEEEIARLRAGAPQMWTDEHEVYVLKTWVSHSVGNLQLLLWRLHGFLAGGRSA